MSRPLNLSRAERRRRGIGEDLLGVVRDARFVHAECFETVEDLLAAVEDEENGTIVLTTDDWVVELDVCEKCHEDALYEVIA